MSPEELGIAGGQRRQHARRNAWLLFFACLFIYNANLRYTGSFDTLASRRLPFRVLTGHGVTFDDVAKVPENVRYSFWRDRSGRWISFYPVFTPLAVTLLYAPAVLLEKSRPYLDPEGIEIAMEKLSASLIAALSVAVLFLTLRKITSEKLATWLAIAYAFGTSTWAVSSQSLWPHGMGELLLACALYLLALGTKSPRQVLLLGIVAGLLAVNRPTDALFSLALAVIVLRERRAQAWPFFAAAGALGAVVIAYNIREFGTLTGGYGSLQWLNGRPFGLNPIGVSGLLGLLFSNRGIFLFSPFALLVFLRRWKQPERIGGMRLLLLAYLASLFVHGLSFDWMGGYCYGPRYAIHGLPVLIVALAEPLEAIWKSSLGRAAFVASVLFAIALQAIGAFFFPNGDSGNWSRGLWTIKGSAPVLAFRAGPAKPHFLFLLTPGVATRFALEPGEMKCRLDWSQPPPSTIHAGSPLTLRVRVTNLAGQRWSSVGGFFDSGAVQIQALWHSENEGSKPTVEPPQWLAWTLDPGRSIEREFTLTTPLATGTVGLTIELEQERIGPFAPSSCQPLRANILSN